MNTQGKLEALAAETQWQVNWYRKHFAAFEELAEHYGIHQWPAARVHFTLRRMPNGALVIEEFQVIGFDH